MNGFTDKPIENLESDIFEVKQYISGLCDFITGCTTPMTIAIQGDWGSGKTSMMNMIREQIEGKVVSSWFNTWQYSQFNMDDTLTVSLLSRLISDLESDTKHKNEKVRKALNFIRKFAKASSVIVANVVAGEKAAEAVDGIQSSGDAEMDMPQAIHELKEHFQAAVNAKIEQEKAKNNGIDRLVIFIDDLDRLHPGKAVELLEVLKLFLDCDNCVFVLAIDYEVVSQGVKQKYGELIGEAKGKSFFDKIIQVPFKMPVAQYNVRKYVSDSLSSMGITLSPDETETFVRLIQTSIGCNPRAMKRLFNAFLLLNKVAGIEASNVNDMKILFAILCMQLSFESIYNYIVTNPAECCDGSLLKELTSKDTYESNDSNILSTELGITSESEIVRAIEFMTVFNSVIDSDHDKKFSDKELERFSNILGVSTITASTSSKAVAKDTTENKYRHFNRSIIKDTLQIINDSCNNSITFEVYQAKFNRENWTTYYAAGKGYLPCRLENTDGTIGIDYKIATDIETQESTLSIWIYPADKATNRSLFSKILNLWNEQQNFDLIYLKNYCGFWLDTKKVHCDDRDNIYDYFCDIVPTIVNSLNSYLNKE